MPSDRRRRNPICLPQTILDGLLLLAPDFCLCSCLWMASCSLDIPFACSCACAFGWPPAPWTLLLYVLVLVLVDGLLILGFCMFLCLCFWMFLCLCFWMASCLTVARRPDHPMATPQCCHNLYLCYNNQVHIQVCVTRTSLDLGLRCMCCNNKTK